MNERYNTKREKKIKGIVIILFTLCELFSMCKLA